MASVSVLLKAEEVSYSYAAGEWQLEGVSLEVRRGEVVGIIGPNGSGKSTLLRVAAGIAPAQSGTVTLMGRELSRLGRREIAASLGYLPQQVTSAFDYRVAEVVAMGRFGHLRGAGFLGKDDIGVIERCLAATETTAYRQRPISQLSGGERQRVMLASVLAQEPKVLLLDEPTTGLDLHHQSAFFELLCDQAAEGMGVAVVTHDLNLAGLFCDRLLLLRAGKRVSQGAVAQVMQREVLREAYGGGFHVMDHPLADAPAVLPVRGEGQRQREADL